MTSPANLLLEAAAVEHNIPASWRRLSVQAARFSWPADSDRVRFISLTPAP